MTLNNSEAMERFVTAAIFDPEAGLEVVKLTIRLPLELG